MVRQRGENRPCTTAEVPLPGSEDREQYRLGVRLRAREEELQTEQIICECELVGRDRLEAAMRRRGTINLDDIRRNLRLGMGPCQGGFCMYRAAGIMHGVDRLDGPHATGSLRHFLQERWKGMWPVLYGDQLRQARLDDWIFQGLLDVEHVTADLEGLPTPVDAELQPATLA
jgi:glycerol-3-phosphate dehydrogenase